MKRRHWLGALALASMSTAAVPATTDCTTGSTAGNCHPGSIGQMINHTIAGITGQPIDPYANFFSQAFDAAAQGTWMGLVNAWLPQLSQYFKGNGGTFNGGGATGQWTATDELCSRVRLHYDAAGNLVVPTVPLEPALGAALTKGGTSSNSGSNSQIFAGRSHHSKTNQGHALWFAHKTNENYGDKRDWVGVAWINTVAGPWPQYMMGNQRYFKTATTLNAARSANPIVTDGTWRDIGSNAPCPMSGQSGGEFSFHAYETGTYPSGCIAYAPNYALSQTGYAYAEEVAISFANVGQWLQKSPYGKCSISRAALAMIVQKAWEKAAEQPGYDGPPPQPVHPDDVRTGGEEVITEKLVDPPTAPTTTGEPDLPSPDPEPTPTPTPTSSDGPDYTHTPVGANEPTAPEIDWWPDLPTVSLSFGTPACPTYDMSVPQYGWEATLDAHCGLIEANAAVIAAICMMLYSVASILIVLRA